jgi:putative membrane protein
MGVDALPTVNAVLNATSAVLLGLAYRFIRRRRVSAHRATMLAAVGTSVLFLASYLTYHAIAGVHRFQTPGAVRTVYLAILGTHTVLAAVIVPLVLITLIRGLRGRFVKHRRIARWTWPLWMYVSVTGVVIYLMLYHLDPALQRRSRPPEAVSGSAARSEVPAPIPGSGVSVWVPHRAETRPARPC